jgi:hypothetical protein
VNDFKGTWKTRGGRTVEITIKGWAAPNKNKPYKEVFVGRELNSGLILFWDLEGNSMNNPKFDLISRGTESYGSLVF